MAKCKSGSEDESPHRKRRKITTTLERKDEPVKIQTVKDLRHLLAFEQDTGPQVRQRVQSFKIFLETIAYGKDSDERSARRVLLLEYLQSQTPPEGEESFTYLADFVRTCQFAAQANVESLFSSVLAVLALLLKTISSLIEFRNCGNYLCKSLLQDDQVKLFDRGLSASKAKKYLISPCLRLLTEIVSFDGGHSAKIVFRQREITFKRLEIFLGMGKDTHAGEAESHRRPSIRNNALRYLYANLKLQAPAAKMNLLAQGKVVRAVFEDISRDSPSTILELLGVLKKDVASDGLISNSAKSRFFNGWTLSRLATLYSYPEADNTRHASEGCTSIQRSTHNFLMFLCTSPDHGVLESPAHLVVDELESRFLPERQQEGEDNTYRKSQPRARNARLALFSQNLRPYASVLQSELILAIFRNTPDLVSDYFTRNQSFAFDPKPTATWIGYSTFLLATVQLPLPESLTLLSIKNYPPTPFNIMIDWIIPHPLTQKIMTRCLNQSMNIIKFLSINILTAAFEKLAKVLRIYETSHHRHHTSEEHSTIAWSQAALDLTTEFCTRIPDIEQVFAQFRNCPKENIMLRESVTRLLALYYEVIPQVALEAKFDISMVLSVKLQDNRSVATTFEDDSVRLLEFDHMLEIAHRSPNIQWWHKSGKMRLSPFTTLLKLCLNFTRVDSPSQQLSTLLASIAKENQILRSDDSVSSLNILILSLRDCDEWQVSDTVFDFLDNCILRLARKPIHYYDKFAELVTTSDIGTSVNDMKVDLLLIAILEQWPFLVKIADAATIANVATWLARYIETILHTLRHTEVGKPDTGSIKVLTYVRDQFIAEVKDKMCRAIFKKTLREPPKLGLSTEAAGFAGAREETRVMEQELRNNPVSQVATASLVPPGPPQEHENHLGLNRWMQEDVQDAITEGTIEELLLCLCSRHSEIRQQAVTRIDTFMTKLQMSRYNEWQQTYVLAGEAVETARMNILRSPLPYFAGVLAARSLLVVADPLHFMYGKVNKFLNKGPRWNVTKLPSYWVDKILLNPPTDDEAHHQEVEWLFDALIDGLCTAADFEIYHGCRIFERLLSLSASPSLPEPCFQKILDLLFRCTYVEGSSALITRCGLVGWVVSRLALKGNSVLTGDRLRVLALRVYETSDQKRVSEWSSETLRTTLDSLRFQNSD